MKKILPLIAAIFSILHQGCESNNTESQTIVSLSTINATNIPFSNTWVISDVSAEGADFAGLRDALWALDGTGRKIALEFPNMIEIPEFALCGYSTIEEVLLWHYDVYGNPYSFDDVYYPSVVSISAPSATTVGSWAFVGATQLTSLYLPNVIEIRKAGCSIIGIETLSLPKAETIQSFAFNYCDNLTIIDLPSATYLGEQSFYSCTKLTHVSIPSAIHLSTCFMYCEAIRKVVLATNPDAKIYSLQQHTFEAPDNIDLYIGSVNADMVNDATLTYTNYDAWFGNGDGERVYSTYETTFKSITIIE